LEGVQCSGNVQVDVYRISSVWQETQRVKHAKNIIDQINHNWVSHQFVIFSFHSKGIPYKLYRNLVLLSKGRHFHCMFHELWVSLDRGKLFKSSIMSALQKVIIRQMLSILRPNVIHTHLPMYQMNLGDLGWSA